MTMGCSKTDKVITITMVRDPAITYSLKVEESDNLTNFIVLDHVVETLFKDSQTGTPEISAVKEWVSSPNQLEWAFTLRPGLVDELGAPLTPTYWCQGVQQVLKKLPKPENMILLSRLIGWTEFLQGKGPFPVTCDDATLSIKMKFKEKPEGILSYLSMPVLGFWKIPADSKFIATGAYKVVSAEPSKYVLTRIHQQPKGRLYNDAVFTSMTHEEARKQGTEKHQIMMPVEAIDELKPSATLLKAYPTQLVFAEFNDSKKRVLGDKVLRKQVYDAVSKFKNNSFKFSDDATKTDGVFFDAQPKSKYVESSAVPGKKIAALKVLVSKTGVGATKKVVDGIINEVLKQFADTIEIVQMDTSDEMWQIVINRDYDVRISGVEAGTHPNKWVAEMMFCSHQGITFIDGDNRICQGLAKLKETDADDVGQLLNQVTTETATLLPLFNKSALMYVGKGVDDSGIFAGSPMPRLDRLKAND